MTEPCPVLPLPDDVPQQLAAATARWSRLRRAARYATFDAWTLAILGALSLICGGYSSVLGLLISCALLGSAFFELRSVARLRRLDPIALKHLAQNQLALAAALIIYALVSLIQISHGGGIVSAVNQQLNEAGGGSIDSQTQSTVISVLQLMYGLLIAIAVLVQGGTAMFYLSRRKHLQDYLDQTPPWVQHMQRERGAVSVG
jgi:hypothetical protein